MNPSTTNLNSNSSSNLASNSHSDLDTEPWFKQGWPWALIAIPFLTIIAGVTTFIIANNTSDTLVHDDYYKKGLAINSRLERFNLAQSMSIIAKVDIDISSNLISIKLNSDKNHSTQISEEISINFFHPTLKNKDQSFILNQLSKNEYIAEIINLEPAYWHIQIEDNTQTWLLKARWLYPDKSKLIIDPNELTM